MHFKARLAGVALDIQHYDGAWDEEEEEEDDDGQRQEENNHDDD